MRTETDILHYGEGHTLEVSRDIQECWVSPYLPNGMPNPIWKPRDDYVPRELLVVSVKYTLDGEPIPAEKAEEIINQCADSEEG